MKKNILFSLIFITSIGSMNGQTNKEIIKNVKKVGLISYLNYVKENSENQIFMYILNSKENGAIKSKDLIAHVQNYTKVQSTLNSIVIQLEGRITYKNNIGILRKSDRELKKDESTEFNSLIKKLDSAYTYYFQQPIAVELHQKVDYAQTKGFVAVQKGEQFINTDGENNILDSVENIQKVLNLLGIDPYQVFKDSQERKDKKVTTTVTFLNTLKMKSFKTIYLELKAI